MSEWKKVQWGDFAQFRYGKMPDKKRVSDNSSLYPIFSGYRIVGYYDEYNTEAGEVIVVARGVGGTGDVKLAPARCYLTNLSISATINESVALKKYLYYYFALSNLRYLDSGSAQSQITISDLQNVMIPLPSIREQQAVVDTLSALDAKIAANTAINHNLEQTARAIFKSWFVDFEPFGGVMLDDWREVPLSEVATFTGGYSYKSSELLPSTTAMATIKNFERKSGFKIEGFKEIVIAGKIKPTQYVEIFDILVAHTDLTQNADVIGNAEMLMTLGGYERVILSLDLVKVVPSLPSLSRFLLASFLRSSYFKSHALGYVNGTTVLHLSKKALPEYTFVLPSGKLNASGGKPAPIHFSLKPTGENVKIGKNEVELQILLARFRSAELPIGQSLRSFHEDVDI